MQEYIIDIYTIGSDLFYLRMLSLSISFFYFMLGPN